MPSAFVSEVDWPLPIINLQLCNGCGQCVQACPEHALSMEHGKAIVSNPERCAYHGDCESACPEKAIARPFLVI